MSIPFLDMYRMHEPLVGAFLEGTEALIKKSAFVNGAEVVGFEKEFAEWVGTRYCVGMASGLEAEVIGLRACGMKPGDKAVVPAMTFTATAEAVIHAGGDPVLVDIDDQGQMDLVQAEKALADGAKFLLPVHLYGQLKNASQYKVLADKYGALVFEDACQAHGANEGGRAAGTLGKASAFSFYPGKNLGALGDGGALCTDDENVVAMAKALREHGQTAKNVYTYDGYTARLDNLQALYLRKKLPYLNDWNQDRIRAAGHYLEQLQGLKAATLQGSKLDGSHVYHLLVVLTPRRDQLVAELTAQGIGFGMHYPVPLHKMACYQNRPWAGASFPVAEKYAAEGISLPIFPGITNAEIDTVCAAVRKICA